VAHTDTAALLALNQRLLDCIAAGDWKAYVELCDPDLTAIEPEAPGQVVAGTAFHKFYFDLGKQPGPRQTTMCQPVVHVQGDLAVIAYVRLVQKTAEGVPTTVASAETRIWRRSEGRWRQIHFHRSPLGI
jgi:calcium/calmodulin-dependent protein kinase (CaM kinase) II